MTTYTIQVVKANELSNDEDLISALRETLVPVGSNDPVIYTTKDFLTLAPEVLNDYPELEDAYNELTENLNDAEYIAVE